MDNPITYLYLKLSNKQGQIEMEVYRKPTTTDTAINNTSCHPKEHKLVAFKNWIHRLLMLPLNENSKKIELNTIINIAITNRYKKNDILILCNQLKHKQNNKEKDTEKDKKMGYIHLHQKLHM
jgi:gluconate kinase